MKKIEKGIEWRLRQAIKQANMSRNQLGIRSGVNPAQLCYFIQGKRTLTLQSADKLAKVLGLELVEKKRKKKTR